MMKKSILAISLLPFALATYADDDYDGERHYKKRGGCHSGGFAYRMDKDDDGMISLKERTAKLDKIFSRIDENEDGIISKKEVEDMPRHHRNRMRYYFDLSEKDELSKQQMLEKLTNDHNLSDTDKDGKVSMEEMRQFKKSQRFARLDTNQDGSISKTEFMNAKSRYKMKRK